MFESGSYSGKLFPTCLVSIMDSSKGISHRISTFSFSKKVLQVCVSHVRFIDDYTPGYAQFPDQLKHQFKIAQSEWSVFRDQDNIVNICDRLHHRIVVSWMSIQNFIFKRALLHGK